MARASLVLWLIILLLAVGGTTLGWLISTRGSSFEIFEQTTNVDISSDMALPSLEQAQTCQQTRECTLLKLDNTNCQNYVPINRRYRDIVDMNRAHYGLPNLESNPQWSCGVPRKSVDGVVCEGGTCATTCRDFYSHNPVEC